MSTVCDWPTSPLVGVGRPPEPGRGPAPTGAPDGRPAGFPPGLVVAPGFFRPRGSKSSPLACGETATSATKTLAASGRSRRARTLQAYTLEAAISWDAPELEHSRCRSASVTALACS